MLKREEMMIRNALKDFPKHWHKLIGKRVVSCEDVGKIQINEVLNEKQREVLTAAKKYGYFDFPRKINLTELSKKLNISASTLCSHIQKIEHIVFF